MRTLDSWQNAKLNAHLDSTDPVCDECGDIGAFCAICSELRGDCKCVFDSDLTHKWLQDVFEVDDWREVDPSDALTTFNDKCLDGGGRFERCTSCGGPE